MVKARDTIDAVFVGYNAETADAINELNEREIYYINEFDEVIRVDCDETETDDASGDADSQAVDCDHMDMDMYTSFSEMTSITGLEENDQENYGELFLDDNTVLDSIASIYTIFIL